MTTQNGRTATPPAAPARRFPASFEKTDVVEAFVEFLTARVLENLETQPVAAALVSPYLNVEEAADYLRCSKQRVYDLLSSRRLTKYRDGSRPLVVRQELDDYLAAALPSRCPLPRKAAPGQGS